MAKENHPKTVITRFIISKLLYSINIMIKRIRKCCIIMVQHSLVYVGARVSVVVRVALTQNLTF